MNIKVSHGEIVDKLTILQIKKENITDPNKLDNIIKEYEYLFSVVENDLGISTSSSEYLELLSVNKDLWVIEDDIRDKERQKEFDEDFVSLARSVYYTNDVRAKIKKEINLKYSSGFIEEKSYSDYL
jgi:heterodisulfide reductase subunit A-like polyferredoxin